ncbi:MAG: YitT family protein [Clostridia bacterium]|nr:YitT family protein [Clostridia bacterium]
MEELKAKKKSVVVEYLILTIAIIFVAMDIHFFRIPNNFVPGGCSGIGILLGGLIKGISTTNVISILTLAFLLIGWIFLGKNLGIKTTYCTLLYTGVLELLNLIAPIDKPLLGDKTLELIISCSIACIGTAFVLKNGGSTGGTEIIAIIIRKYTKTDISSAMVFVDILIAGGSFFLLDPIVGVYSILYLLIKSFGVQFAVDSINSRKNLMIITTHPEEVEEYIMKEIVRGATEWEACGVFTDTKKKVVVTVVNKYQAAKIRAFAKKVDPQSFIIINDCHEIYGNGFLNITDNF